MAYALSLYTPCGYGLWGYDFRDGNGYVVPLKGGTTRPVLVRTEAEAKAVQALYLSRVSDPLPNHVRKVKAAATHTIGPDGLGIIPPDEAFPLFGQVTP